MKRKIIFILSFLIGIITGMLSTFAVIYQEKRKKTNNWKNLSEKHLALMLLLNQWLKTKQEGKSIIEYLHKKQIHSVAIYGMSYIGERLFEELKETDITVKYAIDKNVEEIYAEISIISPNSLLSEVDAVIVTAITYFDEIQEMLSKKINCPIISLEEILYEV